MPRVSLKGTAGSDNFGTGLVLIDGEERVAHYWATPVFKDLFVICGQSKKPESQDDWKAVVWNFGGPKPSKVESVSIHITEDTRNMVLLWKEKEK